MIIMKALCKLPTPQMVLNVGEDFFREAGRQTKRR
jgi:hypothetical protein